ncbi:MAG: hypothetical protein O3B24_09205, partial [Verrucomicrobia bacterium]|nr:hypothetical protein [Verrucomicrobiota bacterium]
LIRADGSGGVAGSGKLGAPLDEEKYKLPALTNGYEGGTLKDLLDEATICAAGQVGVDISTRRREPTVVRSCDRTMMTAACHEAFEIVSYHIEIAFHDLACARAHRILAPQWFRVMAVARALDERGQLTVFEVMDIAYDAPLVDECGGQ